MKSILSYILLSLYLVVMFKPYYSILEYYANQDYIAKYLCVNRYEIQTHCQGKCYLIQKLKERQTEESQQILNQFKESPIHIHDFFSWNLPLKNIANKHQLIYYFLAYKYSFIKQIFHPPIASISLV